MGVSGCYTLSCLRTLGPAYCLSRALRGWVLVSEVHGLLQLHPRWHRPERLVMLHQAFSKFNVAQGRVVERSESRWCAD